MPLRLRPSQVTVTRTGVRGGHVKTHATNNYCATGSLHSWRRETQEHLSMTVCRPDGASCGTPSFACSVGEDVIQHTLPDTSTSAASCCHAAASLQRSRYLQIQCLRHNYLSITLCSAVGHGRRGVPLPRCAMLCAAASTARSTAAAHHAAGQQGPSDVCASKKVLFACTCIEANTTVRWSVAQLLT